MRQTASRASTTTQLVLGAVTAEVALLKTTGEPVKLPEFVRAGPSGGALRKESRLIEGPETARTDPLTQADPGDVGVPPEKKTEMPLPDDYFFDVTSPAARYRDVLVEEGTGYEFAEGELVCRGIRDESGAFIDLTENLARIEAETQLEAMEVAAFIRVEQVPRERVTGSYYLATSDGNGAKVLRLVYEAMRETKRVAVVKWTRRTRQALGVIVPHRSGALMVLEIAWDSQWRDPGPRCLALQEVEVSPAEVAAAAALINALADSRHALDELEDDAVALRRDLVKAALEGHPKTWSMPSAPNDLAEVFTRSAEVFR